MFAVRGAPPSGDGDREILRFARELRADRVPLAVILAGGRGALVAELAALADVTIDEIGAETDPLASAIEELRRPDPGNALVVADEPASVAAARAAGFGLVVGIARDGERLVLREHGADWIAAGPERLTADRIFTLVAAAAHAKPNPLASWNAFAAELAGRPLAVFLDYDGTLAPIVFRPEHARLSAGMRETLGALATTWPTFVVSGRDLEDVRRLVGIEGIAYAGSHGFDIAGPKIRFEVDPDVVPRIAGAAAELRAALAVIPGARVEDKRFSVAVHHREVAAADVPYVERVVDGVVRAPPGLRKTLGKKVFEVRPEVEWDKGRAVLWLIERLGLEDAVPLYVGDDVTDEDAFRALASRGVAVLVSETPMPTAASWSLQDVDEVEALLRRLTPTIASSPP